MNYRSHQSWWTEYSRWADAPSLSAIPTDDGEQLAAADEWYNGHGRETCVPPLPQSAGTPAGMEAGWLKLVNNARRDVERFNQEQALAAEVAALHVPESTRAAIVKYLEGRSWQRPVINS